MLMVYNLVIMRNRNKNNGFTIIEIMIVLVVAGLILLIVFLAVPAVERSARNVSRKDDAGILAAARQQYDINNATINEGGADQCPTGGIDFMEFCTEITSGMTYYKQSDIYIIANGFTVPTCIPNETTSCPTFAPLGTTPLLTPDNMITETYLICNNSNSGATTTGADPNDAVVLYALESAGSQVNECLQTAVTATDAPTD